MSKSYNVDEDWTPGSSDPLKGWSADKVASTPVRSSQRLQLSGGQAKETGGSLFVTPPVRECTSRKHGIQSYWEDVDDSRVLFHSDSSGLNEENSQNLETLQCSQKRAKLILDDGCNAKKLDDRLFPSAISTRTEIRDDKESNRRGRKKKRKVMTIVACNNSLGSRTSLESIKKVVLQEIFSNMFEAMVETRAFGSSTPGADAEDIIAVAPLDVQKSLSPVIQLGTSSEGETCIYMIDSFTESGGRNASNQTKVAEQSPATMKEREQVVPRDRSVRVYAEQEVSIDMSYGPNVEWDQSHFAKPWIPIQSSLEKTSSTPLRRSQRLHSRRGQANQAKEEDEDNSPVLFLGSSSNLNEENYQNPEKVQSAANRVKLILGDGSNSNRQDEHLLTSASSAQIPTGDDRSLLVQEPKQRRRKKKSDVLIAEDLCKELGSRNPCEGIKNNLTPLPSSMHNLQAETCIDKFDCLTEETATRGVCTPVDKFDDLTKHETIAVAPPDVQKTTIVSFSPDIHASVMPKGSQKGALGKTFDCLNDTGAAGVSASNSNSKDRIDVIEKQETVVVPLDVQKMPILSSAHDGELSISPEGGQLVEGSFSPDNTSSYSLDASVLNVLCALDDSMEIDELDSAGSSNEQVGHYLVKPSLAPTLRRIMDKHGDIAQGCQLKSREALTGVLEAVCTTVEDLQKVDFSHLKHHHLKSLLYTIADAELVNLDMTWLRKQHEEVQAAIDHIKSYKDLKGNLKEKNKVTKLKKKSLEFKKAELEKLQAETHLLENQVEGLEEERRTLKDKVANVSSACKEFCHKSIMDGVV